MQSARAHIPPASPSERVAEMYRMHGRFVWQTLARFGVPEADRPDQLQEVFVVVHRRLHEYRAEGATTTWLYAIARRVASTYRRRSYQARERPTDALSTAETNDADPERSAEQTWARMQFEAILDRMSLDQRAVFVMFEIDGLTGQEIADLNGCPLQTVFSRLRRARKIFEREVARLRAVEQREAQ